MTYSPGQYVRTFDLGVCLVLDSRDGLLTLGRDRSPLIAQDIPEDVAEPAGRFYVKTSYHVWTIIDRATDCPVESIGARGRGDAVARSLARETCDALNARHDLDCAGENNGPRDAGGVRRALEPRSVTAGISA